LRHAAVITRLRAVINPFVAPVPVRPAFAGARERTG
jgi:hypothetical protein